MRLYLFLGTKMWTLTLFPITYFDEEGNKSTETLLRIQILNITFRFLDLLTLLYFLLY